MTSIYEKYCSCCKYTRVLAARWFGPAAAQATKRLVSSTAPVQAMVLLKTQSLLQPSFASSTIKRTAPAACSKSLLASTLKSGQHYFQQRGSSVPRVGMRSALRPLDTSLKTPAAAAALRRLGKPFNFVLGHSYRGQSSFACAAEARQ